MLRRAVVTGGSSGIGAEVVAVLAAAGWEVLAAGRDRDRLERVAAAVAAPVQLYCGDLTSAEGVEGLVEAAGRAPLQALVHAAGVVSLAPLSETEPAELERLWRINLHAPVLLTQRLMPQLRAAGGHVVMVNSGAGRRANPGWGAYAASKFALRAVADAWREEERAHGVRFTSVYPGRTDTPMQRAVFAAEGRSYDAAGLVPAVSVALSIRHVLETMPPALLTDVEVRPA